MVRWVVFDLGETLVDETRSWGLWADHVGVPRLTFFAVLGAVISQGRPHTDAFSYFPPGAGPGPSWCPDQGDLYPDAVPTLHRLRERGYRLAVMANQPLSALPLLSTLPVDLYATSEQWGVAKPDPAFFDRVAATVGEAPGRIAYVGDRVDNDVLPAAAAGMVAVHLRRGPWGVLHSDLPEAAAAAHRLGNLAELPGALGPAD